MTLAHKNVKTKFFQQCSSMMKNVFTAAAVISFSSLGLAQHDHEEHSPVKLGSVSEFYSSVTIKNARGGNEKSIPTSEAPLSAVINVNTSSNGTETIIGEVKGSAGSNVFFTVKNGQLEGTAVIPSEEKAYEYYSDAQGNVFVKEVDAHDVICINMNIENGTTPLAEQAPPAGSSVYNLQSLPGAVGVVYLDFDGQYVSGTRWNGGNPIDAQPANMTEAEITEIWKMISEDFRPFNLNITTNEAVFNAAPANRKMRCIFTPTKTAAPTAGGVAYLNSFSWGDNTPCWVFNSGVKGAGEAGSHEVGHTFGLSHDGRITPGEGYYQGQGNWAPIMGVGYYKTLAQWSRGEYTSANNTEDDLALITQAKHGII